jgi:hypothetical protein
MTDVIFLHLPGALSPYRSPDHLLRVDSLPIGVLGLADLLQRSGISSEVVHLGVEWMEDPPFSLASYLKDKSPRTVALDLHWHHQSFDVIETARQIKAVLPQTYILLGGLTASFFHEEIMKDFPSVDGIIRGEAEGPLVELASALLQQKEDLFSIPNLTWRRKGKILINPLSYVASEEDLRSLSFANFSLLRNHSKYIQHEALISRAGKIAGEKPGEREHGTPGIPPCHWEGLPGPMHLVQWRHSCSEDDRRSKGSDLSKNRRRPSDHPGGNLSWLRSLSNLF